MLLPARLGRGVSLGRWSERAVQSSLTIDVGSLCSGDGKGSRDMYDHAHLMFRLSPSSTVLSIQCWYSEASISGVVE